MKPGDLILVYKDEQWGIDGNQLALVVKKQSTTRKGWHQCYQLLLQSGRTIQAFQNCGLHYEIIAEV